MRGLALTLQQAKYYDAVKWLVSDERCTGKTTLFQLACIEKAISRCGYTVCLYDHNSVLTRGGNNIWYFNQLEALLAKVLDGDVYGYKMDKTMTTLAGYKIRPSKNEIMYFTGDYILK
jgi:hypothetical protein